jgi:hypothetical protein
VGSVGHPHATARDSHLVELLTHEDRVSHVSHHLPKNGRESLLVNALRVRTSVLIKLPESWSRHLNKKGIRVRDNQKKNRFWIVY